MYSVYMYVCNMGVCMCVIWLYESVSGLDLDRFANF